MSKGWQGRRTHGSFAELSGGKASVVKKCCAACGGNLLSNRATYCGPCYDVRLEANIAANRSKYRKPRKPERMQ